MITPTTGLWLTSVALLALGVTAHYRAVTGDTPTNDLTIVRYLGVLCGGIGTLGIPAAIAITPYITPGVTIVNLSLITATVIGGIALSHFGWEYFDTHPNAA